MALDIDKIRSGRRRDWESLRDPEERRAEIEAAKEAERAKRVSRARLRARQRRREQAEWLVARRRSLVLVGAFIVAAGGYALFQWTSAAVLRAQVEGRIASTQAAAEADRRYYDLSDPHAALGSWRNAWLRGSAVDLVNMRSARLARKLQRRMTTAEAVEDLQSRIDRGGKLTESSVAAGFRDPEIIQLPRNPRQGSLAVFASPPIAPDTGASPREWVAVFSYDDKLKQWGFEELRRRDMWIERWSHVDQVQPPRAAAGRGTLRN